MCKTDDKVTQYLERCRPGLLHGQLREPLPDANTASAISKLISTQFIPPKAIPVPAGLFAAVFGKDYFFLQTILRTA